jgi:FAD synthetase
MKRVMVFGVFDLLHEGHRAFLAEARRHGDILIVLVSRDRTAEILKGKRPRQNEKTRRAAVEKVEAVSSSLLGDKSLSSYRILLKEKPDIICLGYDQDSLEKDLCTQMREGKIPAIPLRRLAPHKPEKFHTSLAYGAPS